MKRKKKKWIETDRKRGYFKYSGGAFCGDVSFFSSFYGVFQTNGNRFEMQFSSISKEEAWAIMSKETEKRIADSAHNNIFNYAYGTRPDYYRYGHCSCNVCGNDRTYTCQCMRCRDKRKK